MFFYNLSPSYSTIFLLLVHFYVLGSKSIAALCNGSFIIITDLSYLDLLIMMTMNCWTSPPLQKGCERFNWSSKDTKGLVSPFPSLITYIPLTCDTNSTMTLLPLISTTFPSHLLSTPRLLPRPLSPWWDGDLSQHCLHPSFPWWHANLRQRTLPHPLPPWWDADLCQPCPPPSFLWWYANLHQCAHPLSFVTRAACKHANLHQCTIPHSSFPWRHADFRQDLHQHCLHPLLLWWHANLRQHTCPFLFISMMACKPPPMHPPLSSASTVGCRSLSTLHCSFVCAVACKFSSMRSHPSFLWWHADLCQHVLCLLLINAAPCPSWWYANLHHYCTLCFNSQCYPDMWPIWPPSFISIRGSGYLSPITTNLYVGALSHHPYLHTDSPFVMYHWTKILCTTCPWFHSNSIRLHCPISFSSMTSHLLVPPTLLFHTIYDTI